MGARRELKSIIMRILIFILSISSFLFSAHSEKPSTTCAFKVEALSEELKNGIIVRKIKLTLIRTIAGENGESVDLTVSGKEDPDSIGSSRRSSNSLWLQGSLLGETVIVSYRDSIEKPDSIIVGANYIDDVAFVVTFPKNLDMVARQHRIDEYLATHPKIFLPRVSDYIAGLVLVSECSNDIWNLYVKGNPLNLKDAPHYKLFATLSEMMDDTKDENGRSLTPELVRKERINLWISEFVSQLAGKNYLDARFFDKSVRLLALQRKKHSNLFTTKTKAEIDILLSSDALSAEQRAYFEPNQERKSSRFHSSPLIPVQ